MDPPHVQEQPLLHAVQEERGAVPARDRPGVPAAGGRCLGDPVQHRGGQPLRQSQLPDHRLKKFIYILKGWKQR